MFEEGFELEPNEMIAWTCAAAPPQAPSTYPLAEEIFIITEDDEPAELEISSRLNAYVVMPTVTNSSLSRDDSCLVFTYQQGGDQNCVSQAVIERTHTVLTREEALQNAEQCKQAMIKELNRWHKHGAWRRMPLAQSTNPLKSKWVLKWKQIQGRKDIKGRLVAQGFQDQQSLSTFSGTTSRWGQRIVLAASVQFGWPLVSADVSEAFEAFLRGITFQQLAKLDESQPLRVVEIALPSGSEELLRTLPGMTDFDPSEECLSLLKPGFGLKDAPRLWNLALQNVLKEAGLTATQTDRQLCAKHVGPNNQLCLLLSVHVDDIKITGLPSEIEKFLKILTNHFDELKLGKDSFEHLGLKHETEPDGSRSVNQEHYVQELKFIAEAGCRHDNPVDESLKMQFMSHLGGIAWTVQTRPDIAVFTAALQRKLQSPTGRDIIHLNRILAYLKRKPLKRFYRKVDRPWKVYVISDSSFKGSEDDALAMRSGIIAFGNKDGPVVGSNPIQIIEYVSKKQSRVCRSTYTAELYSALDLVGLASNINSAMTEVLTGCKSASKMVDLQENGQNALQMDVVLDARAVFDSVAAADVKATTDKLMLLHALKLKELLALRVASRMLWVDTRDMLSDALNKGSVSRDEIRKACSEGVLCIQNEFKEHVEART